MIFIRRNNCIGIKGAWRGRYLILPDDDETLLKVIRELRDDYRNEGGEKLGIDFDTYVNKRVILEE